MVFISNILKDGKLISYEEWIAYVDSLKKEIKTEITDESGAVEIITEKITGAIKKRIPETHFGILLSGGIDSTLISFLCKNYTDNFTCYSVGLESSPDIDFSLKAAEKIGLNHKTKILSLQDMESLFFRLAKILGKELINIVNIGVGAVELAAIELAKKDGANILFGGLGSEEIFAGYQRHENSTNINEECWHGLKSMWKRDFLRDCRIADSQKIKFLTPFLDRDLILAGMSISGDLKIKNEFKKYILRKSALSLGLPKEFAFRPKKAAQYGSKFDKAISNISKSKGFKYKSEYLNYLCNNK
ncbi:asparagine synthase C-terminal domain-containing protein [Candidatus Woesearchaeota archaeon]|nr:asparagine synthase C-terminal domain-containing protein [Candidatus Woesearchaeota archaeon]